MALVFSRLAHNFIKNGYYPTDNDTTARCLSALDIAGQHVRILDPCCGEGVALAEIQHYLQECGANAVAHGVEFDQERAWHAKTLLDSVIHADLADVFITQRSMGLLFLNPPYGDVVADKAGTGDRQKRDRLEKIFLRRSQSFLQFGGVLVLIVPHYVLDTEMATLLARNFTQLKAFMAPEQRFKQCVVFGVKRRSDTPDLSVVKTLEAIGQGELPPELPEQWHGEPYVVPSIPDVPNFSFNAIRIDAAQLDDELTRMNNHTLWPQFSQTFSNLAKPHRRPLRDLSPWHLALALAAGQICGAVTSNDGRTLLIKGDTFKDKSVSINRTEDEKGGVEEVRVATDKFVPVIRGIDFTPGANFGEIVTIR